MKTNKYVNIAKPLNGFRATHRNRWLFVQSDILSLQELSLLEYYADIFDFDPDHKKVGLFTVDFSEIAKIFNCSSTSTVRNWHNALLKIGFIQKTNIKSVYFLTTYSRYIAPGGKFKGKAAAYASAETNQDLEKILQNFEIDFQNIEKEIQPNGKSTVELASNVPTIAISSSKEAVSKFSLKKVVIKQEQRTEEEYRKLEQENENFPSKDDMRWIDENLVDEINVTNENEQKLIDTYFDGNREKFLQNLKTTYENTEYPMQE